MLDKSFSKAEITLSVKYRYIAHLQRAVHNALII